MIPLGPDHETRYAAWLRERHPTTWRHYLVWPRSLRRTVADRCEADEGELRAWIASYAGESRRAARKGLRKYLQWAQADGISAGAASALRKHVPLRVLAASAAAPLRRRASGTVKDRQIHTMLELYQHTGLPASAVGQLRFEDLIDGVARITWRGRAYPLPERCRTILQRWLRLRERLRSLPEEQRRHRRPDAWTGSDFLFPNVRGGRSGYGVIWRAKRVSFADGGDPSLEE